MAQNTLAQNTSDHAVILKPKRDKPVRQGHPWIFSGAIHSLPSPAQVADGEIVSVVDSRGTWLAQGYLNRRSQIQVRLLSWDADKAIDDSFWRRRLVHAIDARRDLSASQTTDRPTDAYRLVNAESDFLPGLTVDRYADFLVLQSGTLGIDRHKERLAQMLLDLTGCTGVIERSDATLRSQEGLEPATGLLAGRGPDVPSDDGLIPSLIDVRENGLHFAVDVLGGQKTGFYTDQRQNRALVADFCRDKRVLNAFSYTGAFGVHALAAGAAHVVNVDASVEALTLGEENLRRNGIDPDAADAPVESIAGDLFQILRAWRELPGAEAARRRFDVIVLDPPKFAQSKRAVDGALRGYKDINMLALHLLNPGGILATFSCSGLVSADLFQKVIFGAAVDVGRSVQILHWMQQSSDHPTAITFPEGAYLKGLLCRVL